MSLLLECLKDGHRGRAPPEESRIQGIGEDTKPGGETALEVA